MLKNRQITYENGAQTEVQNRYRFLILQVWGWGHLEVFGVIWGQNPNIFKPRQIIYQNKALCPVINIKLFSRSSEVI